MLKGGYTGKILRINLTDSTFSEEELPEEAAKDYIGGAGFGIKYLLDEVPADIDPLCPENKIMFAPGPLSGTSVPCASRMSVAAKSPLTGAVGMCMTGGHFPVELKFAGYDMLVIEGKADELTYLYIKDSKVSFRKAAKLKGTNTSDCQQIIKDDIGDQNVRIACIGPAGENLSKMACIINERRAAGRKGLGAVMGSKNLKAIAVRGTQEVKIADPQAFNTARKRFLAAMKESPVLYPEFSVHGTPMVVEAAWGLGIFPTKNYSATGVWGGIEGLGSANNQKKKIGNTHCYKCPVGCSQLKLVTSGPYAGSLSEPEYETMYSFGGATGVDNLDAVIAADKLCDELGLDTMSIGATIGFAMELYEKGIIGKEDTDGMELNFGNDKAMVELITKIAFREGLGAILADGTRIAAEKIGNGADQCALTVKGLEMPGYDVRGAKAHGLSFATSYTGADHNRGYAFQEIFGIPVPYPVDRLAIEGKGKLTKWNQDNRAVTCDCATMCAFLMDMAVPAIAIENTRDLVNAVSGLTLTSEEVAKAGERLNNAAKIFNTLAGLTRDDDVLPKRIMMEPIQDGGSKGQTISKEDLDFMLNEYYEARGWQENSVPSREKLKELGLAYFAEKLEAVGLKKD